MAKPESRVDVEWCAATNAPSITIAICTADRPAQLTNCLDALSAEITTRCKLLIVENTNVMGAAREVAEEWNAEYIHEPRSGLARARNTAWRSCGTEYVVFIDDDAVPEVGWLAPLSAEFADPEVAAVTGAILPRSLSTEAERASARMLLPQWAAPERAVFDKSVKHWFEAAIFGGVGNGGNMAFRVKALSCVGGFDERLGSGTLIGGGEENQVFRQLLDAGWRIIYNPQMRVKHPYPHELQDLETWVVRLIKCGAAYATLVLIEDPQRWRALRYIVSRILRQARPWRQPPGLNPFRLISRSRAIAAAVTGPFLYFRSRLGRRSNREAAVTRP